jgi:hypothetical protein
MKRIAITIFFALWCLSGLAQRQPAVITLQVISDLSTLHPETVGYGSNAVVRVLNGSSLNLWNSPRTFVATNAIPAFGTNLAHCIRVSTNSNYTNTWCWISEDRYNRRQDPRWFGAQYRSYPTDDIAPLQACRDWIETVLSSTNGFYYFSAGGVIALGSGEFYTSGTLELGRVGAITVEGDGGDSTKWITSGAYDTIRMTNNTARTALSVRRIGFVNYQTNVTSSFVRSIGFGTRTEIENCITQDGGYGFRVSFPQGGRILGNLIQRPSKFGVWIEDGGQSATGLLVANNEVIAGRDYAYKFEQFFGCTVMDNMSNDCPGGYLIANMQNAVFKDCAAENFTLSAVVLTNANTSVHFDSCQWRNAQWTTNTQAIVHAPAFVSKIRFSNCFFQNVSTNGLTTLNAIALLGGSWQNFVDSSCTFQGFTPSRPYVGRFTQDGNNGNYNFYVPDSPAFAPAYGSQQTSRSPTVGGLSTIGDASLNAYTWERYSLQSPVRIWNLSGERLTNDVSTAGTVTLYQEDKGSVIISSGTLSADLTYQLSTLLASGSTSNAAPYARIRVVNNGTDGLFKRYVAGAVTKQILNGEAVDFAFDPTVTNWAFVGAHLDQSKASFTHTHAESDVTSLTADLAARGTLTGNQTWSGLNTNSANLTVGGASGPFLTYLDTGAAVDQKKWQFYMQAGGALALAAKGDTSGGTDALILSRSGSSPTLLDVQVPLQIDGAYADMVEGVSAPASPAAGYGRLAIVPSGAKKALIIKWSDGTTNLIALHP